MKISLKENYSKEQRNSAIKFAWQNMGLELYEICQSSEKIKDSIKSKLTRSVCEEYARQQVIPFLNNFASGDFELNYEEENAISLANVISHMKEKDYDQLIEQIKEKEEKIEEGQTY